MSALRQPTPPDPPSVTALASTSPDALAEIRAAYTFVDARNESKALGILAQRPDVSAILLEALSHVEEIFGGGTPVLLIATDHYDGHPPTLSARITASGTVPEQLAKRDAFYRAWWLGISGEIDEILSFGV